MGKLEKAIAIGLQASAAVLFMAGGVASRHDAVPLLLLGIPGLVSGIAGLLLWERASRSTNEVIAPPVQQPVLGNELRQTQEMLATLEQELQQLREDRRFYQELYGARGERTESRSQAQIPG